MSKDIQKEKTFLEKLKEKISKKEKNAAVAASLVAVGTASLTGCTKDKTNEQQSITLEPTITTEQTIEEITTENEVTENRIDQIIDEYNNKSGKNIDRTDLGIIKTDSTWCVIESIDENGNVKYYCDATKNVSDVAPDIFVDAEKTNNIYFLVDTTENTPIASLGEIKGKIVNIEYRTYVSNDKLVHYYNKENYITLNETEEELNMLSSYLDERIDYIEGRNSTLK